MILKNIFSNKGILGINARNLLYLRPYNPKKAVKLADDKIKTKQFLSTRGIPVPKLYGIIKTPEEANKYDFNTLPHTFVIKPNHGYGGEGIIPIIRKEDQYFVTAGNNHLSRKDIVEHINDVLDGRFSILNLSDWAFFEQYIIADEKIGKYSYEGLPDIRVVVHNLIPVMAMLRLPTKESKGKANLHLGAVGVGIDIAKGETTYISYKNKIIDELPDGKGKIRGMKIPYWDDILLIASKVQLITNLGYMAADISLDKNSGPVILEINARAGLGVQIANLAPLRKRLERIEGIKVATPTKGVRIAKDMFGNIVEKEIAHLSGKKVIGIEEEIEIIQKTGVIKILAKINPSEERSVIDEKTAMDLELLDDTNDYDDEKSTLKLKFSIKNQRIQTIVDVEKIPNDKYKIIIGKRDLKDFLIDSSITEEKEKKNFMKIKVEPIKDKKISFYEIDQDLIQIDSKIKLLYHLRPLNLAEEKEKFLQNNNYNPQFEYAKLKFDTLEIIDRLNKIKTDDSPLGRIFEAKKQEILDKIALLDSIDEFLFTEYSIKLFGKPLEDEIDFCRNILKEKTRTETEDLIFGAEELKVKFEEILNKYNLKNWKVKIKESMVADCVAGKNNSLFIKKDAKFSKEKINSLIIHEIETHLLTAENGKFQPYEIFNRGLANYLVTQEGLAIYNVEKQTNQKFINNTKILINLIAINEAFNSSFSETFSKLLGLNISKEQAFRSTLKAKRGFIDTSKKGAFTKDYLYFKGYKEIKEFINNGGNLKDLYIGKINLKDLAIIKTIPGIKEAKILPTWLK